MQHVPLPSKKPARHKRKALRGVQAVQDESISFHPWTSQKEYDAYQQRNKSTTDWGKLYMMLRSYDPAHIIKEFILRYLAEHGDIHPSDHMRNHRVVKSLLKTKQIKVMRWQRGSGRSNRNIIVLAKETENAKSTGTDE